MKVENTENLDKEEETMRKEDERKLIAYLEKKGWTAEEILDLLKYLSE